MTILFAAWCLFDVFGCIAVVGAWVTLAAVFLRELLAHSVTAAADQLCQPFGQALTKTNHITLLVDVCRACLKPCAAVYRLGGRTSIGLLPQPQAGNTLEGQLDRSWLGSALPTWRCGFAQARVPR